MREEVMELKKDLEEIKEESFAMEIIRGDKKVKKYMFIIILTLIITNFITGAYLVWLLNDIEVSETYDTDTIDIEDVEQIDNSTIKIGDDTWVKSE